MEIVQTLKAGEDGPQINYTGLGCATLWVRALARFQPNGPAWVVWGWCNVCVCVYPCARPLHIHCQAPAGGRLGEQPCSVLCLVTPEAGHRHSREQGSMALPALPLAKAGRPGAPGLESPLWPQFSQVFISEQLVPTSDLCSSAVRPLCLHATFNCSLWCGLFTCDGHRSLSTFISWSSRNSDCGPDSWGLGDQLWEATEEGVLRLGSWYVC